MNRYPSLLGPGYAWTFLDEATLTESEVASLRERDCYCLCLLSRLPSWTCVLNRSPVQVHRQDLKFKFKKIYKMKKNKKTNMIAGEAEGERS